MSEYLTVTFVHEGRPHLSGKTVEDAFTAKYRVQSIPREGETVFLQMTHNGGAPVDLIPWRVKRIEHRVTPHDGRGALPDPHSIRVVIE